jgi:hypothetical protein
MGEAADQNATTALPAGSFSLFRPGRRISFTSTRRQSFKSTPMARGPVMSIEGRPSDDVIAERPSLEKTAQWADEGIFAVIKYL